MLEHTFSLPATREWLLRKENWMSDTVQSEILEQFAHAVQRKMVARASDSHYYGLTADGTTDTGSSEHLLSFVLCGSKPFPAECIFGIL